MKFRKKPIVIDAIRWIGNNEQQIMDFVGKRLDYSRPPSHFEHSNTVTDEMVTIMIPTLEGVMTCNRMDYVIKGVNGEFYPCKPDIFKKSYEPVDMTWEEVESPIVKNQKL